VVDGIRERTCARSADTSARESLFRSMPASGRVLRIVWIARPMTSDPIKRRRNEAPLFGFAYGMVWRGDESPLQIIA